MSGLKLDSSNEAFMQAVSFVNQTNQNIYLTGKAGTGKTTFLKYIREHSYKKMAITAPTGVAAMNAGGTTLHSLFWLPFGTFIEDYEINWNDEQHHIYNKSKLFSTIKLTKQRRALLQEIELLVIDEVSMVRADTLDAIDVILKSVRRDMRPFGGLQVLFIGDLYQLPPVVKDHEWNVLKDHYAGVFFFNAKVIRQHPPVMLELNKIYRQKDEKFIHILNGIRNNNCAAEDLQALNSYYKPDFVASQKDQYITLTSHNRLADKINQEALTALGGKLLNLKAVVKDDFSQGSFPAEEILSLKVGAQVMFIRNDSGEDRKYFNGKIGTVKEVDLRLSLVTVSFSDGSEDVKVKRETWEHIKYNYDKGQDQIKEEVMGTFSQYPLRLAWAITIHKSQGLTFEKAIIDAGTSFAAGQVYVALSRLTGLEGLVLRSPIPAHSIRTDYQVIDFANYMAAQQNTAAILENCQRNYLGQILMDSFRWDFISEQCQGLLSATKDKNIDAKEEALAFWTQLATELVGLEKVAQKFIKLLYGLLQQTEALDYALIGERTDAAVKWFLPKIDEALIAPVTKHRADWEIKKRTKKYIDEVKEFLLDIKRKREQLQQCLIISASIAKGEALQAVLQQAEEHAKSTLKEDLPAVGEDAPTSTGKIDTKKASLNLFLEGLTIEEIAVKRGLVKGTIYGHLINYVGEEIEATQLIGEAKLARIIAVIKANPDKSSSELKMILGADIDYPDIRIGQKVLGL